MKLTKGKGTPTTGGCWMVAAQQYTENKGWHAHPACVDPIIRGLCVWANDTLGDGARERVIGPILFEPVGTTNPTLVGARLRRLVEFALNVSGVKYSLPAIPTEQDYHDAANAANAAYSAYSDYSAYSAAANAVKAAANAVNDAAKAAANADAYAANAANAANAAAYSAYSAYSANAADKADVAEHVIVPLILELCAMSTPREVCPVRTKTEVLRTVCLVQEAS